MRTQALGYNINPALLCHQRPSSSVLTSKQTVLGSNPSWVLISGLLFNDSAFSVFPPFTYASLHNHVICIYFASAGYLSQHQELHQRGRVLQCYWHHPWHIRKNIHCTGNVVTNHGTCRSPCSLSLNYHW